MKVPKASFLSSRRAAIAVLASFLSVFAYLARPASFPQEKLTSPGPLSRAHSSLEGEAGCQKCHEGGKTISSEKCLVCHKPIAERIASRKGVHREVSGDCEACHVEHGGTDVDLRPLEKSGFDHGTETGFALEGKHASLAKTKNCAACHKVRSYLANQRNCDFCHTDPHQGAMPQPCAACHTQSGWSSVSRAFHKAGLFPLEGRHLEVPCASCHLEGVYKGTPNRCYDCHWIRRQDDRYATALGTDCGECHRPISWTAVNWEHSSRTGIVLNPAHQTLDCESCHLNKQFKGASIVCYSCHREDYERASDPNHLAAGFPTACELCHLPSQTSWNQANMSHASVYPLVGVHAVQACSACHKNNIYAGTPRECYGCHRTDYEQTTAPNHAAAGFSTSCDLCHKPSDPNWNQAVFDHNSTYPLQGVHATLTCSACHKNNVYAGTPRECYGCHRTDYEQARDPNHLAAGFPTTCDSCHRASDTSWDQGRFDHTWFPITSGKHAGNACSACHPDKNNFKVFSCLTCHDRGGTDEDHQGVSGYKYDSQACYACHPQGRT